jgi:hypothetical protein
MGDIITFTPNTGVNPTFDGRGSKIEHPDIYPIFLGPYWPGSGDMTVLNIMNALRTMVNGAYLRNLMQYGYSGSASVRVADIITSPVGINYPALAPGVSQITFVDNAIYNYVNGLVNADEDKFDDNHDLIVVVFLDPSIPCPQSMDAAGNISGASGSNSSLEQFEFLDDNIRFEWVWVCCAGRTLASVTQILSHELVEAISDPFNSGWHQSSPPPAASQGQIGDVCNQPGIVDGVSVSAYWSVADNACILPTAGIRRVGLSQMLTIHEPHDGPERDGYVQFPIICGGGDYFKYKERTYRNQLKIQAQFQGYESPVVAYTINGQVVPVGAGSIEVDADWDIPHSNPLFPDLDFKPRKATLLTWNPGVTSNEISIGVGPDAGNVSLHVTVEVSESFDTPENSANGTTKRSAVLDVDLLDQEIIWDSRHDDVKKNCDRMEHLSAGVGVVVGPPQPGDPPGLIDMVTRALQEQGAGRGERLKSAAQMIQQSRPEIATALEALAQRSG